MTRSFVAVAFVLAVGLSFAPSPGFAQFEDEDEDLFFSSSEPAPETAKEKPVITAEPESSKDKPAPASAEPEVVKEKPVPQPEPSAQPDEQAERERKRMEMRKKLRERMKRKAEKSGDQPAGKSAAVEEKLSPKPTEPQGVKNEPAVQPKVPATATSKEDELKRRRMEMRKRLRQKMKNATGGGTQQRRFKKPKLTAKKIEQKMTFVESSVKTSPTVKRIRESGNEDAITILDKAVGMFEEAKVALEAGDLKKSDGLLNDAIKEAGKASRMAGKGERDIGLEKEDFASHKKSISNSLSAIERIRKAKPDVKVSDGYTEGKALFEEGLKLGEDEGKYREANKKMARARALVNDAMTKLRDKDTVTMTLEFDTPADEYKYVHSRYLSYATLVEVVSKEKKPTGRKKAKIDEFVAESAKLMMSAIKLAEKEEFGEAIKVADSANKAIAKGLRLLGVMVFE